MTRAELLLISVMEECDEVSQRASKALRFGLSEVQEGQPFTNAQRIVQEWTDLRAVLELLHYEGILNLEDPGPGHNVETDKLNKIAKIQSYLKYSEYCGTLKEK